jgi:cytochrome c553
MSHVSRMALATAVFAAALAFAAAAQAQKPPNPPDPPKAPEPSGKAAAAAAGKRAAAFCANCHGEDGNSRNSDVPNLAGQNQAYLALQMRKFTTGERKNKFKEGLLKLLPPTDLPLIAVYYADTPVVPAVPRPAADAARGRDVYAKACANCHGAEARGTETLPRLAGQQVDYLKESLQRYRSQSGERVYPQMSVAVGKLTDADVTAVIAYLASAR